MSKELTFNWLLLEYQANVKETDNVETAIAPTIAAMIILFLSIVTTTITVIVTAIGNFVCFKS